MTSAPDRKQPDVCFVVAESFHGATLLALLLNNHSKISALGDTNPSREFDQGCSCGESVRACGFWKTISDRTEAGRFAELGLLLPSLPSSRARHRVETVINRATRTPVMAKLAGRTVGRAVDEAARATSRWERNGHGYVGTWRTFYSTVAELHGTSLVADGEKSVTKAALLARSLGHDRNISTIHLLRDPRGFVNSWRRHYGAPSLAYRAKAWADFHGRAEALSSVSRYTTLRYEDLAADPEREIARLLDFLSVPPEPLIGSPSRMEKHHLIGNIMLTTFEGSIELDERWRSDLSFDEQSSIMRSAGQRTTKYGYV
jgi:hypothetical protein